MGSRAALRGAALAVLRLRSSSVEGRDEVVVCEHRIYNKLWDVLACIAADPEAARADPRNRFVSSRKEWGTHILG